MTIKVNLNLFEATTVLPYLGRKITYNFSDWVPLYSNLRKYRRGCGVLAKVLGKTGSSIRMSAMMYKVVV